MKTVMKMKAPVKPMDAILDRLEELSEWDLRTLNQTVVGMIRSINKRKARAAAAQFNLGDYVSFVGQRGFTVIRIDRINSSTIGGKTQEGQGWRVAPTLLKPSSLKEWKGK